MKFKTIDGVTIYEDGRIYKNGHLSTARQVRVNGVLTRPAKLVAMAFIPNPDNKLFAILIDPTKPASIDNVKWSNDQNESQRVKAKRGVQDTNTKLLRRIKSGLQAVKQLEDQLNAALAKFEPTNGPDDFLN